ncbi:MlaC/ttg2D family ABC transporter substrate-binding protein [Marinobacter sp. OP 3.4]|uniref:MlaC/ttg2D family ABC transporter substrate-binding protein n=1 Tax=Marinobacter sp. OP 3.4 TaxID=3076501 RepID=UPI002E1F0E57
MTAVRSINQYAIMPWALAVFALVAALLVRPAAANSEQLASYVDENTQKLVQRLNEEKGLYSEDPDAFYREMEAALEGFVDFRRIAARVMGRYARQTTPEQRDEFVVRFKRSLFESYAQALVNNSDGFEIVVQDARINPRDEDRASVDMLVTTESGDRYQVTYSMYRNTDSGDWMMENVIVEGVNIGLAFRDRFAQEMESRRGDVDAVIKNWGDAVASLNLDEEMDKGAKSE